jgi:PQQ-dependent dehydrogenase (methanol/ethanol family)
MAYRFGLDTGVTARIVALGALVLGLAGATGAMAEDTGKRIVNADSEPENWLSYGRTYSEQRYSPLDRINLQNVKQLGLAWFYDLDESYRPIQGTPLVVDGVMFVSEPWSKVFALDAATGKELWKFDPEVPKEVEVKDCCKAPNRGLAYWNGKLFVGTLDGRLVAIDAKTGKMVWQKVTVDPDWPYVIAGAPRVVKGKVIIGNSGGDLGMRGYISAYDAETGDQAWRFYTVPGDPKKGFENDAMKMAATTWTGEWWKMGGGGAVWESIVYDPDLNLIYFGTGNALPWNRKVRSPGGGDNLFTASIVAVNADTGKYAWHYQAVPGEVWDYDNTMPLMLARLKIAGKDRKVIMQAPKDGFFYVLDAASGKLISAEKEAAVNWASGIDMKTGRPIENPAARYPDGKPILVQPGSFGGHGWYPMAFSPRTGLVYFGSSDNSQPYGDDPPEIKFERGYNNTFACVYCKADEAPNPALPLVKTSYSLLAWDPVKQKQVWRDMAPSAGGGVLATAGDLVFQPGGDGNFSAYNATDGEKLWSMPIQNVGITGPISYSVAGEQYIAVAVGKGYQSLVKADPVPYPALLPNTNRVLVFKLNGKAALPAVDYTPQPLPPPPPPPQTAGAEIIRQGYLVYNHYCFACHGLWADSDRVHPDLKYSTVLGDKVEWARVLEDGVRKDAGMVSFKDVVSPEDAEAIRAYVISRAQEAHGGKPAPGAGSNEQPPIH